MNPAERRATACDYDDDFVEWTRRTAELLRAGRFTELDVAHLAEEVEDMGRRDARELSSRIEVLLLHLLKWRYQPNHRSPSWRGTIDEQRAEIDRLIADSPSLARRLDDVVARVHGRAARRAAGEIGLTAADLPPACPWTIAALLDEEFLPD